MFKIIFGLGLLSTLSFSLYGANYKCTTTFSPTLTDAKSFYKDEKVATMASADYKSLKAIYDCILPKSKAIGTATKALNQADYEEVIQEALSLENSSAKYSATLLLTVSTMQSKIAEFKSGDKVAERILSLNIISGDVATIRDNAKNFASGTFALAGTQQPPVNIPVNEKIAEWTKSEGELDKSSTLYKLDNISRSTVSSDIPGELSKTLKGGFASPDAITKYTTELQDRKYDLTPSTQLGDPLVPNDNKPKDNQTDNANNNNKSLYDLVMAQYLKNLSNNNNSDNNNNSSVTPVSSANDKDKGSGSGGSGSLAGATAGSRNTGDDDERKEIIARAKEREKMMMRMDVQRALYGTNPNGKSLRAPSMQKNSAGSSLRDIFAKRFEDADKSLAKKGTVPSLFGGADNEDVKQGDEKYKGYFKGGAAPASLSAREATLNRFTDMYETARLSALTEDADQEFAGRYIDLFLLVHTILDHEYRDKGKLIDLSELIPSPLGPKPGKQRP